MPIGTLTSHLDVAQVVLYAFWIFFAILVLYLRREDRREGYPLVSEPRGGAETPGFFSTPNTKVWRLFHGGEVTSPYSREERPIKAVPSSPFGGSPLIPTGNPLLDGVGPASWSLRSNTPDLTFEGLTRIAPLRVANDHSVDEHDRDPRGFKVIGADGEVGGIVRDLWVDRSEVTFRYLEVEVEGGKRVLLPITFSKIDQGKGIVKVESILGGQFVQAPTLANPDRVTRLEEDKIVAYYGGGILYAEPSRQEPII
ncbi:MAG: photosynthetic reaction center subunit H [Rhodomicrobium sp.]|jgi:photosynthetic reaction center H subunit